MVGEYLGQGDGARHVVSQQIEKDEDVRQRDESAEPESEVEKEAGEHIRVHNAGHQRDARERADGLGGRLG